MKKLLFKALLIYILGANQSTLVQAQNENLYGFTRGYSYKPCKVFNFNLEGIRYYFIGKYMMFDEINYSGLNPQSIKNSNSTIRNCKEDSLQVCQIFTPGTYRKEVEINNDFLSSVIIEADTLNKYLKQLPKLNKMELIMGNSMYSDSVINHLSRNIISIDSLVIFDDLDWDQKDNSKKVLCPMKNQFYESAKYFKILSKHPVHIPAYVFEPKTKPIETIVFVCDSLENFEGLTKLTKLKKLTFLNTKNMDAIMPYILQLQSLEELYIAETDLRRIPRKLLILPALKTLVLEDNNKLKKIPVNIKAYKQLSHLKFIGFSKKGIKFTDKLNKLSKENPTKYQNY